MKPSLSVAAKSFTLIVVLVVYVLSFLLPTIDVGNTQVGFLRKGSSESRESRSVDHEPSRLSALWEAAAGFKPRSRTREPSGPYYDRLLCGWEVFCQVILKLPFSLGYLAAWMANAVLWFGLFALAKERWRRARIAAWLCLPLGLTALLAARGDAHWLTILLGYYVWLLSFAAFLICVEVLRLVAMRKLRTA